MRLYVGGISYAMDSNGLNALFTSTGFVSMASIAKHQGTGQSKGFGYVEMPDATEAKTAICRFDGQQVNGLRLIVTEALSYHACRTSRFSENENRDDNGLSLMEPVESMGSWDPPTLLTLLFDTVCPYASHLT